MLFRVYLTRNSDDCSKIFFDEDTTGVDIITMSDISLHITDVSHCSDDTEVIELSDFTFKGLPCNLSNEFTMFAGPGT